MLLLIWTTINYIHVFLIFVDIINFYIYIIYGGTSMQVTISIDKEVFDSDEIGGTIKAIFNSIPEEEKVVIVKDLMMQYLTEESVIKNYLVEMRYDRWTSRHEYCPTINFNRLIEKIDLTTEMEDIKKKMIDIINNELENILIRLFVNNFVGMLSNTMSNDSKFINEMTAIIQNKLASNQQ